MEMDHHMSVVSYQLAKRETPKRETPKRETPRSETSHHDGGLPDSPEVCTLALMRGHLCVERASLWLGGLAAFGIVAAHCLAYVLTAPDPAEMSLLMDMTGHRYWGLVVGLAMAMALGGAVRTYVRGLNSTRTDLRRRHLFVYAAPRLGVLQLVGFALLESFERVLWGAGMAHPLEQRVVLAGLALQVVVAVVAALVLSVITKLVTFVVKYLKRTIRAPKSLSEFGLGPSFSPRVLLLAGGGRARGPPGG